MGNKSCKKSALDGIDNRVRSLAGMTGDDLRSMRWLVERRRLLRGFRWLEARNDHLYHWSTCFDRIGITFEFDEDLLR